MTLFNVVVKNLKHNLRHYALYIGSMTFGIIIYFTFVSLHYNDQVQSALDNVDKLKPLLEISSVILLFFIVIFIAYSNAFFIKKRKQEIGLYSLLGVPKKKIANMLFFENFLLSLFALLIGIFFGELFSVFFAMLLVKLMGFTFTVTFSLNIAAIIQTAIFFLILAWLISWQGYYIMYRFRLIDLFQAKHQVQKQIKPSFFIASLAVLCIGFAYFFLLSAKGSESWADHFGRNLLGTIILMIAGSYFLFHSLGGFCIRLLQKRKAVYYKWKNLLTFTQLKSRLKSNAILLTTTAVLNSLVLVCFGFAYTIYYNTLGNMEDASPYSYQYQITSKEMDQKITNLIRKQQAHPLLFDEKLQYIEVASDANDFEEIPAGFLFNDNQFTVISTSMYNQIAKPLKRKQIENLQTQSAILVGKEFVGSQDKELNVGRSLVLAPKKDKISLRVIANKQETVFNEDHAQTALLIVHDGVFNQLKQHHKVQTDHVFKVEDERNSEALTKKVEHTARTFLPKDIKETYLDIYPDYSGVVSFSKTYGEIQAIYGMLIFIAGFLGLVFLSATGSIIYFKMLNEAREDAQRYHSLRKIGMRKGKVTGLIARQYGIIFLLPLLLGIAHSCVLLGTLSKAMDMNFMTPLLISNALYTLLYGSYYVLTIASGNKLVNR